MKHLLPSALAVLLASSCVTSHEDGDFINPAAATFHGLAAQPDETISVYARNQQTEQWELVRRFVSEQIPFGLGNPIGLGGATGYFWQTTIDFRSLSNFTCFFGAPGSCILPADAPQIDLQFRSGATGNETVLGSHDPGGLDCTLDQIRDGAIWSDAGNTCAANNLSPGVLTLQATPADPLETEFCASGTSQQWRQVIQASAVGHYHLLTTTFENTDPEVSFTLRDYFPHSMLIGLNSIDAPTLPSHSVSERRAYYTFNVNALQGQIVGAEFRFFAEGLNVFDDLSHATDPLTQWGTPPIPYLSDDPTETFELHSVSTDAALLRSPTSDGDIDSAFFDLFDGPSLASVTVTPQTADEWLAMPLDATILPGLNAARELGQWSLGGGISSTQPDLVRSWQESVFIDHALYGASNSVHFALPPQLVLTLECSARQVPVPTLANPWSTALLASLLCGLGLWGLSRRRSHLACY